MTRGLRGWRSGRGCRAGWSVALGLGLAGMGLGVSMPAGGDSIEPTLADAKGSFEQHARSWMANLERSEARNRQNAPVYSVAQEAVIRFDGYSNEYETQVKATGEASAPFVGILRYKENVYTCLRDDESRCTVTSSVPVSEIFSYKNGRWDY